jgi:hypothetical protein
MTAVLEEDEEKQSIKNDQGVLAAARPVRQKKKNVGKYKVYVFGQR